MSKTLNEKNLSERPAARILLAVSLCASMVAFGCTTDRTVGNGDPVVTPGVRTTPTGATTGSESEAVPPPMISSSTVMPRALLVTPAQAAAIMAAHQPPRVRVLGTVSSNSGRRPYESDLVSSAAPSYGRVGTINSSINSSVNGQPLAAITSGAGEQIGGDPGVEADFLETIGALDPGTDVPANAGNGATLNPTSNVNTTPATGTTAAPSNNVTNAAAPVVSAPTATAATPTASSVNNTSGTFASVGTLSPTAAAVVNPPASVSASPTIAATGSTRTAGRTTATRNNGTTPAATAQTQSVNTTAPATIAPTTVPIANPVRVVNRNGRVVITNANSGRQQ